MTTPFLEHIWLSACDVDCDCDAWESLTMPLDLKVDVEALSVTNRADGRVVVTAGLSLGLCPQGTEKIAVDLMATFRLAYRMPPLHDLEQQRSFVSQRALADVWPLWRTWLHQTLALMGLAPTPLPAEIPSGLRVGGREAFNLTIAVERSLPERGAR